MSLFTQSFSPFSVRCRKGNLVTSKTVHQIQWLFTQFGFKIHVYSVSLSITLFPLELMLCCGDICEHRRWETAQSTSQTLTYFGLCRGSFSSLILRHDIFPTSNPLTCRHILKQSPSWLPLLWATLDQLWNPLHIFVQVYALSLSLSLLIPEQHFLMSTGKADVGLGFQRVLTLL